MTGSTVGAISTAFQDEGFAPNPDCTYEDNSVRRQTTQEYMESVDWTDFSHVARALRVFERLMEDFEDQYTEKVRRALRQDGYVIKETGEIVSERPQLLPAESLANLKEPAAILEQLERIRRAMDDDPPLAVGSAKEVVESTAKVVLTERGLPVDDRDDVPALVSKAQQALGLHPSSTAAGPDSTDAVKKILGGLMAVTIGLAELRNRGYGTGHGASGRRVGLRQRHAHLAVNAAMTWCQLMLDTLTDEGAPWRRSNSAS
jgi:hypothetical protein